MSTTTKKPREFWIAPKLYNPIDPVEAPYFMAYDEKGDPKRLEIHTIEISAYQALERKLEIAKAALEFIAKTNHGRDCDDLSDLSARAALKEIEG